MALTIEKFEIKNESRGNSATRLATFSVNFGAMSINGFELIQAGNKTFSSAPHRRYQSNGEWKRYSYVWFNDSKGQQIQEDINKLAIEEYHRRSGEQAPVSNDADDDEYPF